ncbi:hypothetical protein TRFO_10164 [Tritrichomonas foetus]|uniref:Uncharacterized protein n=1 Tax=Tritrichomonas foetus TaxID=1144522 RepID=A0A1J4JG89_9EUKA|nr:hypothetical protein TRFO_10164 [Tritrichomonas foetus]|eukprot:OHS96212.1 hypothetical protein TRFO_10164 [Tritrichomonas foetus]
MFPEPPYINEIEKSMPIFSFDDSKFNLKKDLDKYVDEVLSQNHEKMKIHLLKARNLKKLGLPSTLLLGNIDDKDILSLVVLDNASNHKS